MLLEFILSIYFVLFILSKYLEDGACKVGLHALILTQEARRVWAASPGENAVSPGRRLMCIQTCVAL